MTSSIRVAERRRGVVLLAALTTLLTAVLGLLMPAAVASATAAPAAETRVGAIHPTVASVVGVAEHIAAGQRPVRGPSQPQLVVGRCVAAEELPDAYAGVRQASQYLRDQGVPRSVRKEVLGSFEPGTISVETAGSSTYGVRFLSEDGVGSGARGRYLTPTLPATRSSLALPSEDSMTGLTQFQIQPGATYFSGRVGPNFGYPGGGVQWFVPDLGALL